MHMTAMLRRIEALEKAVSEKCARAAEDRIRGRALEHLSDEELDLLIKWCRAQAPGGEFKAPEWAAMEAYYAALEQERQLAGG
jgi:hypothetical protein